MMNVKNSVLYAESWNIAFRLEKQGTILTDKKTPFIIIPNSIRYWAADPMVFTYSGKSYIFAELYDYVTCKGIIGVSEYKKNQKFGKWKPIIRETFHMSYPFVFSVGNDVFMLPETSEINKVILYKAIEFPMKWKRYKELEQNVKWLDTTLFPTKDGYFAYTNSLEDKVEVLKLTLNNNFEIVCIEKCLEQNPKGYRSGGRMFIYNGNLIRVCQDCYSDYGKALFFREYRLNDMEQISVYHIKPDILNFKSPIYIDGMHTYSATNKYEVIDIKTRRFNLINLFFRMINKLCKKRC